MMLSPLLPRIASYPAFQRLLQSFRSDREQQSVLSVTDVGKPAAVAALRTSLDRPLLLVTSRSGWARRYVDELAIWLGSPDDVMLYPETDALPYEPLPPDPNQTAQRVSVLGRLLSGESPPLVVATVRAIGDRVMSPDQFGDLALSLRPGLKLSPRRLMETWLAGGYEPAPLVELPGQFAHRGGILDVYPVGAAGDGLAAYRIEFWGDEIESIRLMDPATQRSAGQVPEVMISPAYDVSANGMTGDGFAASFPIQQPLSLGTRLHVLRGELGSASLLDYLPPETLLLLDEPVRLQECWSELEREAEQLRRELVARQEIGADVPSPFFPLDQLLDRARALRLPLVEVKHDPDALSLPLAHGQAFAGRMRTFLDALEARRAERPRATIVVVTRQAARVGELLEERGLSYSTSLPRLEEADSGAAFPSVVLLSGALPEGWRADELGLELITDGELFGLTHLRRPAPRARRAPPRDAFLTDLSEGELVVHVDHGIGRYLGLLSMDPDGVSQSGREGPGARREYLLLEYASGDRLYVPVEQADRVGRYVGGGDESPNLTRLGSGEWARAKQRVRRAVRDIAQELLDLYAARNAAAGFAFEPDSTWQAELEGAFPFIETPDQARAIEEVKLDMERSRPMDRLLVGDVGYGKTEVALRAAFKAVLNGKQVAVLVPTTVLAQQHFTTFRERLAAFPIRVEMLSRFRSSRAQREVVEQLAQGAIDICIGTHRLVQRDVRFKDLGLVIIDEEQRFGVSHKERLKQLRKEVDVLTLTATPIPRTLHMALAGARDMSTIATAPENRVPIRTYVMEYDEQIVREVIVRELERGGQVYFVHNRVQGIEQIANRLQKLLPEARIAVAHGQMHEDQLEQAMLRFSEGEADVLVCTTIIESGLDIPNVNTIVVNNAHRLGLAQLYQLRGRVGRGASRAYGYFLYPRDVQLSETAEQRLRTIFEATELGAGFRIAMKDLEIRGAGNLLGAEQSGHISSVGFDLYTRLLAEAVDLLKAAREGGPLPVTTQRSMPPVDLPIPAYLPSDYVADEQVRLNLYQRLASVETAEAVEAFIDELEDRFGPLPEPAQHLIYLMGLRASAAAADLKEIATDNNEIVLRFAGPPPLDADRLARLAGTSVRAGSNQVRMRLDREGKWIPRLLALVEALPSASGAVAGSASMPAAGGSRA